MKHLMMITCIAVSLTGKAQTVTLPNIEPAKYQLRGHEYFPGSVRCRLPTQYIITGVVVDSLGDDTSTKPPRYITEQCSALTMKPMAYLRIKSPNSFLFTAAELKTMPTFSVRDLVSLSPNVYQSQRGRDVVIQGSHTNEVLYIIDGMQIPRN